MAACLAVAAALLISAMWPPQPVEERLVRLQVSLLLPEYAEVLGREPLELQAQFIDFVQGDDPALQVKAWLALQRHPGFAGRILTLYGAEPDFQEVLREYGEQVMPPIQYFLENEVRTIAFLKRAGDMADGARQLWSDEKSIPPQKMTAEERGWYAVQFIREEGHGFLGQFVLGGDGTVRWVQSERVLESLNSFFAGGVRGLETRMRRDETTSASDWGWAALDVAVGISAIKILRMGRGAVVTTRTLTFSERSAALGFSLLRGSAIGLRLAKYGAPVALAYIAVRHPSVLNSLFGRFAEFVGVPVFAMQALGWTAVLLPVVWLLQVLLRPAALLLSGIALGLRCSDALVRGAMRSWRS